MIKYKIEKVDCEVFSQFFCDRCKKEVTDDMERQETYRIRFNGGYGSVFGDGSQVDCDLCQQCLYELIGEFCTYDLEEEGE